MITVHCLSATLSFNGLFLLDVHWQPLLASFEVIFRCSMWQRLRHLNSTGMCKVTMLTKWALKTEVYKYNTISLQNGGCVSAASEYKTSFTTSSSKPWTFSLYLFFVNNFLFLWERTFLWANKIRDNTAGLKEDVFWNKRQILFEPAAWMSSFSQSTFHFNLLF